MTPKIYVNIGSGSGFLPDGTKSFPESMSIYDWIYCVDFFLDLYHKKWPRYWFIKWKKNTLLTYSHISQGRYQEYQHESQQFIYIQSCTNQCPFKIIPKWYFPIQVTTHVCGSPFISLRCISYMCWRELILQCSVPLYLGPSPWVECSSHTVWGRLTTQSSTQQSGGHTRQTFPSWGFPVTAR